MPSALLRKLSLHAGRPLPWALCLYGSMGIAIIKTIYEYLFAVIYYPVLGLFWLITLPWTVPHKKKVAELKKNHLEIWTVQKDQLLIPVSEVDHLTIDNHVVTVVHTDKTFRERV